MGESDIIGWAGLQYVPELLETEVGYLLARPFWGRGYATEAARASLHFGFENFKFDHIIALVHPENIASRRVLEKCGLTYMENKFLWGLEMMRYLVTDMQTDKRM
jgi:ribosomal-protein-alanine N-acetyltransferase